MTKLTVDDLNHMDALELADKVTEQLKTPSIFSPVDQVPEERWTALDWVTGAVGITSEEGVYKHIRDTKKDVSDIVVINTAAEVSLTGIQHYHEPLVPEAGEVRAMDMADRIADLIHDEIHKDKELPNRVVVNCYAGMERSALSIVWYLARYKQNMTIDDAYALVRLARPQVLDRRHWIGLA